MQRVAAAAILSFILLPAGIARAADEAKQENPHVLQDDHWESGGHLRRRIAAGNVPFHKSYAEMTPEEQDYLKSFYEKMGPNDEPPFPKYGLKPIVDEIVRATSRLEVEGPLKLDVLVNSKGEGVSVEVRQSPDPRMTRVAAAILLEAVYKPALCDGKPCAMKYPFNFDLHLRVF